MIADEKVLFRYPTVCGCCEGRMVPVSFSALTVDYEVVQLKELSCTHSGCAGNVAERWNKVIAKLKENFKETPYGA